MIHSISYLQLSLLQFSSVNRNKLMWAHFYFYLSLTQFIIRSFTLSSWDSLLHIPFSLSLNFMQALSFLHCSKSIKQKHQQRVENSTTSPAEGAQQTAPFWHMCRKHCSCFWGYPVRLSGGLVCCWKRLWSSPPGLFLCVCGLPLTVNGVWFVGEL